MKIAISCFFLIAFASFLIVSCEKESKPPPTPPPPPPASTGAVFTIIDPGCGDTTSGIFQSGVTIDSGKKIAVKLNVSDTGSWHLTSDTLNGIYFSGSGVFLGTGEQMVELPATGTPILPGNYRFTLNRVANYTFVISILEDPGPIETVPDSVYFKATINNQDFTNIVTPGGEYKLVSFGSNTPEDFIIVGATIDPLNLPFPPGTGSFEFFIGYFDNLPTATHEVFKDFLKPGSYPIAWKKCNGGHTAGATFGWNHSTNGFAHTYSDGDKQAGSYFKIVGAKDGHDSTGRYFVRVKMRFKCKLTNYQTGKIDELTNGEMVVPFIKFE